MIDGSTWLSVVFMVGYLACLCLGLVALTWLEHPTVPTWWHRLAAWRPQPRSEPSRAGRFWCEDLVLIEGWDRGRSPTTFSPPVAPERPGQSHAVPQVQGARAQLAGSTTGGAM